MENPAGKAVITEPVILIRINQLYHEDMGRVELYDATRGVWKVGERREGAEYAFAVYSGIVREVYKIERWYPAGTTPSTRKREDLDVPGRWEFVGKIADETIRRKYLYKSVEGYFSRGSQNPIFYVNC